MAWLSLLVAAVIVWGLCGAVMGIGRQLWSTKTALAIHLPAAPVFAFVAAAVHALLFPAFDPAVRALVMIGVVVLLDVVLVAPFLERSYQMFRSVIGTWIPFVLIFLAAWLAGRAF